MSWLVVMIPLARAGAEIEGTVLAGGRTAPESTIPLPSAFKRPSALGAGYRDRRGAGLRRCLGAGRPVGVGVRSGSGDAPRQGTGDQLDRLDRRGGADDRGPVRPAGVSEPDASRAAGRGEMLVRSAQR
jgi:hypothetical protein